ncbi:MAG: hypothetical protein GYA55_11615 [SAR324 cluster bacterium]|uniref:Uncharacterized protein n=1 Tax=SAR324 cluster bacterium TaxID=2024889 RepID=A0A7X9FT22_9DELT|nr:hypothetical protein [SAR324 cluster bacterium]
MESEDSEELAKIRKEVLRRKEKLNVLNERKIEIERKLTQFSSRSILMSGNIGKMQAGERYNKMLRNELQQVTKSLDEVQRELINAMKRLEIIEAEETSLQIDELDESSIE